MTTKPRPLTGQPLANLRHERFAAGVVSGLNGTQAWLAVSPNTKPAAAAVTANRLLNDAKVAARIAELRAPALAIVQAEAEEAVFSAAWILRRAAATHRAAIKAKQFGPAVSALTLMSKPLAEFSDKVDARVLHGVVKVERGTRSLS